MFILLSRADCKQCYLSPAKNWGRWLSYCCPSKWCSLRHFNTKLQNYGRLRVLSLNWSVIYKIIELYQSILFLCFENKAIQVSTCRRSPINWYCTAGHFEFIRGMRYFHTDVSSWCYHCLYMYIIYLFIYITQILA